MLREKGNITFLTDKEHEKIKEKDRLGKEEKRTNKIQPEKQGEINRIKERERKLRQKK